MRVAAERRRDERREKAKTQKLATEIIFLHEKENQRETSVKSPPLEGKREHRDQLIVNCRVRRNVLIASEKVRCVTVAGWEK